MKIRFTHAVMMLLVAGAFGCGPKRPAAITGAGNARNVPAASPSPVVSGSYGTEPIAGPDVQPVSEDGATGTDVTYNDPVTGEGGPLTDVLFGYDAANLSDEARAQLEKHALWLQNHRQAGLTIEGHADERGTAEYNLSLGEQRARAVQDYLQSLGVAAERMRIVSYGKERPLDAGSNEAAWARNRRAHFLVAR